MKLAQSVSLLFNFWKHNDKDISDFKNVELAQAISSVLSWLAFLWAQNYSKEGLSAFLYSYPYSVKNFCESLMFQKEWNKMCYKFFSVDMCMLSTNISCWMLNIYLLIQLFICQATHSIMFPRAAAI